MKNKLLLLSLLALSGSLIISDAPEVSAVPKYEFSGKEAVDVLIRNGNCRDCDLSNQDLRDAIAQINRRKRLPLIDLSGSNLSGANLSGADLKNSNFTEANLTGADLSGADLTNARMSKANMTHANCTNAIMVGVNLNYAIMINAILTYANLTYAHLCDVDMTGAITKGIKVTGAYYLDSVIGLSN